MSIDDKGQMELATCDGVNDWKLVCPSTGGTCNADDVMPHFIATPDRNRIAVWGYHAPTWTSLGQVAVNYMVASRILRVLIQCI